LFGALLTDDGAREVRFERGAGVRMLTDGQQGAGKRDAKEARVMAETISREDLKAKLDRGMTLYSSRP
jgi:hypothetical protein